LFELRTGFSDMRQFEDRDRREQAENRGIWEVGSRNVPIWPGPALERRPRAACRAPALSTPPQAPLHNADTAHQHPYERLPRLRAEVTLLPLYQRQFGFRLLELLYLRFLDCSGFPPLVLEREGLTDRR
jgi:hypothetical protein